MSKYSPKLTTRIIITMGFDHHNSPIKLDNTEILIRALNINQDILLANATYLVIKDIVK